MAKWLDENGLSHFWSKLKTLLNNKVDKVDGKGLSTNDYTANEKTKLSGIETGAEVNIIETITVDGKTITPSSTRVVNIDLSSYATDTEVDNIRKDLQDKIDAVEAGGISLETSITDNDAKAISAGAVYDYKVANDQTVAKKIDAAEAEATYAKKTDITNVYRYKGSKATVSALPTTGNVVGDVWNVEERGINYAWTEAGWDSLGELFTIDRITETDINTICV